MKRDHREARSRGRRTPLIHTDPLDSTQWLDGVQRCGSARLGEGNVVTPREPSRHTVDLFQESGDLGVESLAIALLDRFQLRSGQAERPECQPHAVIRVPFL
jgi:hypothetical protein